MTSDSAARRQAEERTATIDTVLARREYVDHLRAVFRRVWDGGYAAAELSSPERAIARAARRYVTLMEGGDVSRVYDYIAKRAAYDALRLAVLAADAAEDSEAAAP